MIEEHFSAGLHTSRLFSWCNYAFPNFITKFLGKNDSWISFTFRATFKISVNGLRIFSIPTVVYLLTYLLTYSMEQSLSWEANRFSASQEIPHILWNSKVHYHIHKSPPPVPILSLLDPVHIPSSYFLKIYLNIILPTKSGSHMLSPAVRFLHQNPVCVSPLTHTCYILRPSHSSRFYHPDIVGWGVQIPSVL